MITRDTRDTRDTMPSFAEREAARRYFAEISALLHDRFSAPGRPVFKRLHQPQVNPDITEKLRGIQVVLEAIASGKRTSLDHRGLRIGATAYLPKLVNRAGSRPDTAGRFSQWRCMRRSPLVGFYSPSPLAWAVLYSFRWYR